MANNPLIIPAPSMGVAQSPHVGFGDVRNLDIHSIPGVARINYATAKKSASIITGTPQWIIRCTLCANTAFAVDSGGAVYKTSVAGSVWKKITGNTTGGTGQGLAIWKDYLFVANAALIDVYGPISGATGTGTISSTTTAVTGVGTAFDTQLAVGDSIFIDGGLDASTIRFVTVITDATHLTLDAAPATAYAGDAFKYCHWTKNWKTIDTAATHPMIVSKLDGKIYGGAGRYVFTLNEATAPFVPATAASFTWTAQHLTLPADYIIACLTELGNNLMIGTTIASGIYYYKVADIFPWDGSSTTYGQPLSLEENGVSAMITINSILYILAGIEGNIYSSNGVQSSLIAKIPQSVANTEDANFFRFYAGSICSYKGRIFFGVGSDVSDTPVGGCGVWSLKPSANGNILTFEHTLSGGNSGSQHRIDTTALCPVRKDVLLIGWYDYLTSGAVSTYGIDWTLNTTTRYTSYAYFDSPLYPVGTNLNKRKFSQLEFQLVRPLVSGQGITISYRTNLTASFTEIGAYVYSGTGTIVGAVSSHIIDKLPIPACEFIQLRVLLVTADGTTPEYFQIILP